MTTIFDGLPKLFIEGLVEYAEANSAAPPDLLADLERATLAGPKAVMLSGNSVGRLLKMLTFVLRPKLAVDVGTFTGLSALSIAEGLPENGKVITCEVSPDYAASAQKFFDRSPFKDRIQLKLGPALETLRAIEEPIGFAFIDADKAQYWDYYDAIVTRLSPNGLIVVDNTLFAGTVLMSDVEAEKLPEQLKPARAALMAFNQRVMDDPRTESCMLTVRDGITVICKRS
jgi:caffeoyl-CoA O-methyltransferase